MYLCVLGRSATILIGSFAFAKFDTLPSSGRRVFLLVVFNCEFAKHPIDMAKLRFAIAIKLPAAHLYLMPD